MKFSNFNWSSVRSDVVVRSRWLPVKGPVIVVALGCLIWSLLYTSYFLE